MAKKQTAGSHASQLLGKVTELTQKVERNVKPIITTAEQSLGGIKDFLNTVSQEMINELELKQAEHKALLAKLDEDYAAKKESFETSHQETVKNYTEQFEAKKAEDEKTFEQVQAERMSKLETVKTEIAEAKVANKRTLEELDHELKMAVLKKEEQAATAIAEKLGKELTEKGALKTSNQKFAELEGSLSKIEEAEFAKGKNKAKQEKDEEKDNLRMEVLSLSKDIEAKDALIAQLRSQNVYLENSVEAQRKTTAEVADKASNAVQISGDMLKGK